MVKSITEKHKKDSKKHKSSDKNQKKDASKKKGIVKVSSVTKTKIEASPILTNIVSEYNTIEEIHIPENESTESIESLKKIEEKILEKYEEIKVEAQPETAKVEKIKLEDKDYTSKVEAILFAVGKYLDEETISQLCEIDKRNVKKSLEELKKQYDARNTALMVVQEGSNWKINVREKYLSLVRKIVADTELSKSIMETLAVIAWKTPAYQNEIVKIRGNKCYDHIEELVNAGFVTKDKKGRSYILKTTDKFYNYFDIDQKNLHGVMSEAKMPVSQTTLEEVNKPEETPYSREKLLATLEKIETKSITRTEEDKQAQTDFLSQIHQKIDAASKRTDEVIADIPKPMHQQEQHIEPVIEDVPPELKNDNVVEKDDGEIVIDTGVANGEHHFQKAAEQPQKPKQLTKKQLEKKFKEELQRVKERSENK